MRTSHWYNLLLALLLALPCVPSYAQLHFTYKSDLATVNYPGFYKIVLPPYVVAKCREGLQDIRILDEQTRQVPYILQSGTRFLPLPSPKIIQKDSSDKSSYITIRFNEDYIVSRIEIMIEGSRFYKRPVVIAGGYSSMSGFSIRSGVPAVYTLDIKTNELSLVVANGDSPPLKVLAVKGWQREKYLSGYFEPGHTYSLMFGHPNAPAPNYDLAFFKDSIRGITKLLATGTVIKTKVVTGTGKKSTIKSSHPWLLWMIIGAVLLLLLALTLQMTKEINQKKTS